MLDIKAVRMEFPPDANIIVGQSHFIKTVEDLYEAVSTTVPQGSIWSFCQLPTRFWKYVGKPYLGITSR